jgi:hypothetical protein
MHRLLTVTTGYLKYTFAVMLAGTVLFSLAGLAVTQPRVFVIVVLVGIALFFIARIEIKDRERVRKHRSTVPDDPKEIAKSLAQLLAFSHATNVLAGAATISVESAGSIFITEWLHTYDPMYVTPPVDTGDKKHFEEIQLALILKTLKAHEHYLARHGIQILFISASPFEEVIDSIYKQANIPHTLGKHMAIDASGINDRRVTIGFQHAGPGFAWNTEMPRTMGNGLKLIRGVSITAKPR